ncbi:IclR family transcriptional regulator [Planococcus salinus]|uniref:IclR family transcriptional regulator n=1 Tax=Planococcus salinus TaxID=1848460 RepID=A0A3M8PAJ1_9BACL|nr:IclR family transcriptional regulator [Planococcus salinus]RNF40204.1 IclR family transcriptional regulator [Planococcus salinus]
MNQSVIKALQLLDYFKEHPELTLAELATLDKMPKPTTYRLISSLEASGFLTKTKHTSHDVKYRLGLKLLELGSYVADQLDFRKIALPHMQQLNQQLNEAVHLAVLEGEEAVYVEKIESKKHIRLYSRVGGRTPLYLGSGPKLLLAYSGPKKIAEFLERTELKKVTDNTITDKAVLAEELEKIRLQGYSHSRAEIYPDTAGFSFPLMDHNGNVIAALVVSVPAIKFNKDTKAVIIEKMRETAANISKDLGYKG